MLAGELSICSFVPRYNRALRKKLSLSQNFYRLSKVKEEIFWEGVYIFFFGTNIDKEEERT